MRSAEEILEGNKSIVKFMECDHIEFTDCFDDVQKAIKVNGSVYPLDSLRQLKYHSSWDWLMPVVEKIESLGCDTGICSVEIKGERLSEVMISPVKKGDNIEIHSRTSDSKIELTWLCVIQFIHTLIIHN